MKGIIKVSLSVCMFMIAATSCKKTKSPTTTDNLVGEWLLGNTYCDSNNNGVADPADLVTDTSTKFTSYIFTADHKKINTDHGVVLTDYPYFWELKNEEKYLQMTDSANHVRPTKGYYIQKLDAKNMILIDTSVVITRSPIVWQYYTKK